MKNLLFTLFVIFLFMSGSALADESFVYVDTLNKISIPASLYKAERDRDFFYNWEAPSSKITVVPVDLNGDGTKELFVTNPYNTSLFIKFWRLYKSTKKGYKMLAEMPCSSIRVCSDTTDGYKNFECYNYVTVVEGLLTKFRFFGDQYYTNCTNRIESKDFYTDQYPYQKKF